MTPTCLARKFGWDGNPLRRRTDKIASRLAALLVAAMVIGAPWLSVTAVRWTHPIADAGRPTARSFHRVPAVLLQGTPPVVVPPGLAGYPSPQVYGRSSAPARWTAPDGQPRTAVIPVRVGVTAGDRVELWVNAAGSPTGPPPSRHATALQEAGAAAAATVTLGALLLSLAWAGRRVLNRRRLADWESAWAVVGPQWTNHFRSRG